MGQVKTCLRLTLSFSMLTEEGTEFMLPVYYIFRNFDAESIRYCDIDRLYQTYVAKLSAKVISS